MYIPPSPMGQICCPHGNLAPPSRPISLIFLLRTRPIRPLPSSPKSALLLALLSISGGNAFASVATLSADPTLVVLELPALCTTIAAALLWPRCMQDAVSMEKPPGTCFTGGGANGLELRRSLWLEVGSVRQRRRVKTGPAAAPCTTITTAVLLPGCMQVAISMEKPLGTCFAGGGANGLELRRSL